MEDVAKDGTACQHLRIASPQAVDDFKLQDHTSLSTQRVPPTGPLTLQHQRNANGDRRRSSLPPLVEATLRRSSSYHGNGHREQGDGLLSSAAARPLWGLKRRNRQSTTSSPATSLATNTTAPRLPSSSSREVPIPGACRASSSPAFFDEESRARQTAHYENATWCMYERIVEGRRRRMVLTGLNAQSYFQELDQQRRRNHQQMMTKGRLDPRLEAILKVSFTPEPSLVDDGKTFEMEL